jgi:drug/metabolite transporter (DMT)-like permease
MRALVLAAVLLNVFGNFLLSRGMHDIGPVVSVSPLPYLRALLDPWVLGGVFLLVMWIIAQLSLLSRADLTYVLPITAISYVAAALIGQAVLGENVPILHWAGILLITAGVALVGLTVPRTATAHPAAVHPPSVVYPLYDDEPDCDPTDLRRPGAR